MRSLILKLAVLGSVGAMAAIPAASQADGFRLDVGCGRFAIRIGRDHCPPPVVVCDEHDWRWHRDHDRDWDRDHRRDRDHDRDRHDRR